jgi:hypothetical protein
MLGAGPRAARPAPAAPLPGPPPPRSHAATLPSARPALGVAARGSAAPAAGDTPGPPRWPGTSGCSASDASAGRAAGMPRYSSALAERWDGTAARTPSGDSAAADGGKLVLASDRLRTDTQGGPREPLTPWVKSRRRVAARLRDAFMGTSRCVQHNDAKEGEPRGTGDAPRPRRRTSCPIAARAQDAPPLRRCRRWRRCAAPGRHNAPLCHRR